MSITTVLYTMLGLCLGNVVVEDITNRLDSSPSGPSSSHVSSAAPIKHDPFLRFDANTATATVGVRGADGSTTTLHPNTYPSHYINAMWVKDQDGNVVYFVNSSNLSTPSSTFSVPPSATQLTPYEYCNLHGLWQGPTSDVSLGNLLIGLDASVSGPSSRHNIGDVAIKHDPFLSFDGNTATVAVRGAGGSTTTLHPNAYPTHYINAMWVKDQDGNIVHFVDSSNFTSPRSSFVVPAGASQLTPYEYCNLHGLWQGPTYDVELEDIVSNLWALVNSSAISGPSSSHVPGAAPAKHDPFLFITSNDSDIVEVGVRGTGGSSSSLHPQSAAHHISTVFITDQHGRVIDLMALSPMAAEPRAMLVLAFGTTIATPYEHCNLHGLWRGPAVDVSFLNFTDTRAEERGARSFTPLPAPPQVDAAPAVNNTSRSVQLNEVMQLEYTADELAVHFTVRMEGSSWFAIGVSTDGRMDSAMQGSDIIICADGRVQRYWVTQQERPSGGVPVPGATCQTVDGHSIMSFSRSFAANSDKQRPISSDGQTIIIFAHGMPGHTAMEYHEEGKGAVSYNFRSGAQEEVAKGPLLWYDILRLVVFIPVALVFAWYAYNFKRTFPTAWFKSMQFAWYSAYVAATVCQILFIHAYPEGGALATRLFNLGGWMITACGITDSCQLLYVIKGNIKATTANTNSLVLKIIMGLVYPALLGIWLLCFFYDAPLAAYRALSCILIVLESMGFLTILYVIRTTRAFTGQLKYFGFTLLCRVGILVGVVLAVAEFSRLVVNVVHFTATMFVVVAMHIVGKGVSMNRAKRGLTGAGSIFNRIKSRAIGSRMGAAGSRIGKAIGSRAGANSVQSIKVNVKSKKELRAEKAAARKSRTSELASVTVVKKEDNYTTQIMEQGAKSKVEQWAKSKESSGSPKSNESSGSPKSDDLKERDNAMRRPTVHDRDPADRATAANANLLARQNRRSSGSGMEY